MKEDERLGGGITGESKAVNTIALGDWEAKVKEYLSDLQAGLKSYNADPQTDDDR